MYSKQRYDNFENPIDLNPYPKPLNLPKYPSLSNLPELSSPSSLSKPNAFPFNPTKPDWTPDFTNQINIEADSVNLALSVLGLSKNEYNSMSVEELKSCRRIDSGQQDIFALNILIYYKKSKNAFPTLTSGYKPTPFVLPQGIKISRTPSPLASEENFSNKFDFEYGG